MLFSLKNTKEELKKIRPKQKVYIIGLFFVLFFIGLLGALTYQRLTASPTPIPLPADIVIVTDRKEQKVHSTFSAAILINSPNQGIDAADFILKFNPKYMKATSIAPGNYFSNYPQKKINAGSIKISAVASFKDNTLTLPQGEGIIATITFETLLATRSSILSLDRKETIIASNGKNILSEIKDLEISIK